MPPSPPTLILGAMPSEIRTIQAQLKNRRSGTLACFPYDTGTLRGRKVVVAVTGVGVTNGAMVSALFINEFAPSELIVSGTGSRFNPRIRTGDTVISTKTIHHAAGSLTNKGMVYRNVRGPLPGTMTSWFYKPDSDLLKLAKASIRSYDPEPVVVDGDRYQPTVLTGVVTASDLFGVSDAKIADMKAKLDPDIMEMESAAIAQVCHQLDVPHIVFRAGSNRTQSNPGNDYRRLGQIAAAAAARWTIHFTGCLAERG
ncbi:MAG TPA: 5'-methylthioadenosine/S-adenosylhomocysteine nucleosidase [Candidatus Limnocylindria bacterium]|jgi:adenosylhomocysteine nucleosidase|nr:5'-methylthioadenosine/S-adenosylhomocysteine nucleosidase [Candidatus Limnocylindria bacterium]